METKTKICSKCGRELPLDNFRPRHAQCRGCESEYSRLYKEANREKVLETKRKYREENRERLREENKQYKAENPDVVRDSRKRYKKKHREQILAYRRDYYQKNKEKINEYNKACRSGKLEEYHEKKRREAEKKRLAEEKKVLSEEKLKDKRLFEAGLKVCSYCGRELPLDDFHNQRRGKFGKRAKCVHCMGISRRVSKDPVVSKELRRSSIRKYKQKKVRSLSDSYVRDLLKQSGLSDSMITDEVIQLKRATLAAKRALGSTRLEYDESAIRGKEKDQ